MYYTIEDVGSEEPKDETNSDASLEIHNESVIVDFQFTIIETHNHDNNFLLIDTWSTLLVI